MMADSDLTAQDHLRKAKWHKDHPNKGNKNIADSHALSAILKTKLVGDERKERSMTDDNQWAFR